MFKPPWSKLKSSLIHLNGESDALKLTLLLLESIYWESIPRQLSRLFLASTLKSDSLLSRLLNGRFTIRDFCQWYLSRWFFVLQIFWWSSFAKLTHNNLCWRHLALNKRKARVRYQKSPHLVEKLTLTPGKLQDNSVTISTVSSTPMQRLIPTLRKDAKLSKVRHMT